MFVLLTALTLRILSNPVANACQKYLGERVSSLSVNFYIALIMSAGCIIPAFRHNWSVYTPEFWLYVFLAGLFCSAGTICLIKALKLGELSILGPLNSYKSVIGLISAFLLLGELPSLNGIAGIFLIVGGSLDKFSFLSSESASADLMDKICKFSGGNFGEFFGSRKLFQKQFACRAENIAENGVIFGEYLV